MEELPCGVVSGSTAVVDLSVCCDSVDHGSTNCGVPIEI